MKIILPKIPERLKQYVEKIIQKMKKQQASTDEALNASVDDDDIALLGTSESLDEQGFVA